ncbi:hypothetical protein [Pseudohalocynthiibacter sp. F2068]|nr:hypothetical protein [Pseudohalocynthiibacter sp. F2068]MCK0101194.1 hypothetical protein [Pseudohalocynthiibacter sp. F2068]
MFGKSLMIYRWILNFNTRLDMELCQSLESLHPQMEGWVGALLDGKAGTHRTGIPIDLTESEERRLLVTSSLLDAVEAEGGCVERAEPSGKLTLAISGETLEFSVTEKMQKCFVSVHNKGAELLDCSETRLANPFSAGLFRNKPTGFLIFKFENHIHGRGYPKWVESKHVIAEALLPVIVREIMASGPINFRWSVERELKRLQYKLEQSGRGGFPFFGEVSQGWRQKLQSKNNDSSESRRLEDFVRSLKIQLSTGDYYLEGRPLSHWIAWAESCIAKLKPSNPVFRKHARKSE